MVVFQAGLRFQYGDQVSAKLLQSASVGLPLLLEHVAKFRRGFDLHFCILPDLEVN